MSSLLKSVKFASEARKIKPNILNIIFLLHRNVHCIPKQCDNGQCCCSTKVVLILGDTYTAEVWKRGEIVGSENISITDGSKLTSYK